MGFINKSGGIKRKMQEFYFQGELKVSIYTASLETRAFEGKINKVINNGNMVIWEEETRRVPQKGRFVIRQDYTAVPYAENFVLCKRKYGYDKFLRKEDGNVICNGMVMDYNGKILTNWLEYDEKDYEKLFGSEENVKSTCEKFGVDSEHYQDCM